MDARNYDEFADPMFGGSKEKAEQYVKDVLKKDAALNEKYFSIEDTRERGFSGGKDMYLEWFTNGYYEPDRATVVDYRTKKELKIASGRKVVDALIDEIGSQKVSDILDQDKKIYRTATLDYTRSLRDFDDPNSLFNRVNKRFKDAGYDGVEDINDLDSDLPVILFDSKSALGNPVNIERGRDAIQRMYNIRYTD